jgi:hypothetical protein
MSGTELVMSVFKMARGFWQARILMTAAELDIFSHLLAEPKTAAQVAGELPSDPRGTERLLDALTALEMLDKKDGAFRVKPGLRKVLSSSAPGTIVPPILHLAQLWEIWGRLTEIVQKGRKDGPFDRIERDEEGVKAFIGAMHAIGRGMAEQVVARLDLTGKENLADRVTVLEGDFYKDDLPGGHDVALLSAIVHQNSSRQNVELYRKVFDSLVPGGTIVIRDHVMSEDHTETLEGALFAVNMLVATPAGGTYSFEQINSDLEEAGFTGGHLLHRTEMDSLVTAQKPAA